MPTKLEFTMPDAVASDADLLMFVGKKSRLTDDDVRAHLPTGAADVWDEMLEGVRPRDAGDATLTYLSGDGPSRVCAVVIPDIVSRHNNPARPDAIAALLGKWIKKGKRVGVLAALDDADHAYAVACASARALPCFSAKQTNGDEENGGDRVVRMAFLAPTGPVEADAKLRAVAEGVRLTAELVDMPTCTLGPDAFVERARAVAEEVRAEIEVVRGEELRDRGFGGLWGVGKAAVQPPALVILKHKPAGADKKVCWVGKGIVYDTGGLSIKGSAQMAGMKRDMGGAAAVLGAFRAAVQAGAKDELYALLCIAENSVGPNSVRPDDILTMYSGKTVEVNNTDAEGRLVVADGVAYASRDLKPDVIIDVATLTGAQMISTGLVHAAIVSNDETLERQAVDAGRRSGDLTHPLVYCPELFRAQFESEVADLKNSVKDRLNAQSSCAAQFIAEHLVDFDKPWLHVDMAGPSDSGERATGYGVALLVELLLGPQPGPTQA